MRSKQLPTLEGPAFNQHAVIARYLDEHAKFIITKDLTFEIHIRSWSEEILQLISMATYKPLIGAFCVQGRPLFTLRVGWQSAESLLQLVGGGHYQSRQIAIVREFVETKKTKHKKKLTGEFRQKREDARVILVNLNHQYFIKQHQAEDLKYQPKLIYLEDYFYNTSKDRHDYITDYIAELSEKELERRVKRQFRKKRRELGITTVELRDFTKVLAPMEQIRYQKLIERTIVQFKIGETTAKIQIVEAVKQEKLIRGGKPHTPAAYFMLNPEDNAKNDEK